MSSPFPSRIIDAHQHAFFHGVGPEGLVADLDAHGISSAWLLSWEIIPSEDVRHFHAHLNPIHARADGTHAGIPLADLVSVRDRYPSRFTLGYCPHPLLGNAPALLRAAASLFEVKVCGEWKFRILFDDPRGIELYRTAGELGMPVVLHLDVPYLAAAGGKDLYQPNWYGGTIDHLERALRACPETNFVGHAPGFWREISADAAAAPEVCPATPVIPGGKLQRLLETYPNLYADLSAGSGLRALMRDPNYALQLLETFSDRFLFGRDYYGGELHSFLMSLGLCAATMEKIYHANAEALLPAPKSKGAPPPLIKPSL